MAKALVIDQNLTSTLQINEEEEEKEDSGYDADVTGNKIPEETNTSNSNTGARRGGSRNNAATALKSKASELTLSFEGKVYVFHKVNPEKVCFSSFLITKICGFLFSVQFVLILVF